MTLQDRNRDPIEGGNVAQHGLGRIDRAIGWRWRRQKKKSEESEPFDSRRFSVKLSTSLVAVSLLVTAALVIVGAVHNRRWFLSMAGK